MAIEFKEKMNVKRAKAELRSEIWRILMEKKVALPPFPIEGRIPNFRGSEKALENLRNLDLWKEASVILINPDAAQRLVREAALREGKTLIVATPRLKQGYVRLSPKQAKGKERFASTIKGMLSLGEPIKLEELEKLDLVIEGSVAVDLKGNRLGKGGGYGDREIREARRLFPRVIVATLVHDLQVVEEVPREEHDQKVDLIVTPSRVIFVGSHPPYVASSRGEN